MGDRGVVGGLAAEVGWVVSAWVGGREGGGGGGMYSLISWRTGCLPASPMVVAVNERLVMWVLGRMDRSLMLVCLFCCGQ